MKKLLVVVDVQNDFVCGALATREAAATVPKTVDYIRNFDGDVVYTMDTHGSDYFDTAEAKRIPIAHCRKNTLGWEIQEDVERVGREKTVAIIEKDHFASLELVKFIEDRGYDTVELLGLCTDLCVISNAFCIRTHLPDISVAVVKSCCAGVSPESHEAALNAMSMCMIDLVP